MPLKLLNLTSIQAALQWYEQNVCNVDLRDTRGFRVRFQSEHFIHHIKLTNKYGKEPKNRAAVLQEIRSGKIHFVTGRYNPQRASEIPWAVELATEPDCICPNWQALGSGDENYVKNFGTTTAASFGMQSNRPAQTLLFPREVKEKELATKVWP